MKTAKAIISQPNTSINELNTTYFGQDWMVEAQGGRRSVMIVRIKFPSIFFLFVHYSHAAIGYSEVYTFWENSLYVRRDKSLYREEWQFPSISTILMKLLYLDQKN